MRERVVNRKNQRKNRKRTLTENATLLDGSFEQHLNTETGNIEGNVTTPGEEIGNLVNLSTSNLLLMQNTGRTQSKM